MEHIQVLGDYHKHLFIHLAFDCAKCNKSNNGAKIYNYLPE